MKILSVNGRLFLSVHTRWLRASGISFLCLSAIIVGMMLVRDRTGLLDQDNYINYFRLTDLGWFVSLWTDSPSILRFAISSVTEELGWRTWVLALNAVGVDPETGVRITVLTVNGLVIAALSKSRRPFFALWLWVMIPVGLATMGLFQVRQGLAFGIAMYFAMWWRRPTLGAFLAATVHTTFGIPALILACTRPLYKRGPRVSTLAVIATGVGLAAVAQTLFGHMGGRRINEYAGVVRTFNTTFVISLAIYAIAPIMCLAAWFKERTGTMSERALSETALMHLGLICFLITAFFIYPFAIARVGYYAPVMVAFLLPEVRSKQPLSSGAVSLVFLMVSYDAIKNYFDGVYSFFL